MILLIQIKETNKWEYYQHFNYKKTHNHGKILHLQMWIKVTKQTQINGYDNYYISRGEEPVLHIQYKSHGQFR